MCLVFRVQYSIVYVSSVLTGKFDIVSSNILRLLIHYLCHRFASGEGIVLLGLCHAVRLYVCVCPPH